MLLKRLRVKLCSKKEFFSHPDIYFNSIDNSKSAFFLKFHLRYKREGKYLYFYRELGTVDYFLWNSIVTVTFSRWNSIGIVIFFCDACVLFEVIVQIIKPTS